jgi:alcohol dehydrogenase
VLGVMIDGGMRERFIVPARKLHKSTTLSFEQLALVETLAIGCHAVNRGNPQPGDNVLVVGAGPIGLSVIEFAKLSGARTHRARFERAAVAVLPGQNGNSRHNTLEGRRLGIGNSQEMTGGALAQVVIDATGSNKSMAHALNFCGFTGRLVYVGITQQEVTFPHAPVMHRRELTLLASRNALPPDFARIIQLIEDGKIDTRPWITHHAAFDEMIEAFPSWLKPETGVIKAMVEVN